MESFDIKKFLLGFVNPTTWGKAIVYLIIGGTIVFVLVCVKNFIFPKPDKQINRPISYVAPFAKVEKVDQSNTQIQVEDKPWEVGIGVGGITYDNKNGAMAGGWVRRRW